MVGASLCFAARVATVDSQEIPPHPGTEKTVTRHQSAPNRSTAETVQNEISQTPLRAHQARHVAQASDPRPNRTLGRHKTWISRTRLGGPFGQLRRRRLYLFAQYRRYRGICDITDIFGVWVESPAVLGKGRYAVVAALDAILQRLPFGVCGIDSENASDFTLAPHASAGVNDRLLAYFRQRGIQFTRGRPYKKNDNAHVEQKNWTQARKLLGGQNGSIAAVP